MSEKSFQGFYYFIKQFNLSLYGLFTHAPIYIGKFFVGSFYGILLGLLLGLWKREIFYNAFIITIALSILHFFSCITIVWENIFIILGINGQEFTGENVLVFCNTHYIEIICMLIIGIISYSTIKKYT